MKKLLLILTLSGCSLINGVTPEDRALGYKREAQAVSVLCKAYEFDLQAKLTQEVPEMTKLCASL